MSNPCATLCGTTILLGRDATNGTLCVVLRSHGKSSTKSIGAANSVPASVSHSDRTRGKGHCTITIDDEGEMTFARMAPTNVAYIDGVQVQRKKITPSSVIALGSDRYPLPLAAVLQTAQQMLSSLPQEYSIAHLEAVWDTYDQTLDDIQRRQQRRNRLRLLPIMIGSLSVIISPFAARAQMETLWVTVPLAALMLLLYLYLYFKKDTSIEERKAATDRLIDEYVCPNPACHHYFGTTQYKVLRQTTTCPHCRCPLTDKPCPSPS